MASAAALYALKKSTNAGISSVVNNILRPSSTPSSSPLLLSFSRYRQSLSVGVNPYAVCPSRTNMLPFQHRLGIRRSFSSMIPSDSSPLRTDLLKDMKLQLSSIQNRLDSSETLAVKEKVKEGYQFFSQLLNTILSVIFRVVCLLIVVETGDLMIQNSRIWSSKLETETKVTAKKTKAGT